MRPHLRLQRRALIVAACLVGLAPATPAWSVTLDRSGKKTEFGFDDYCSAFNIVKASKDSSGGHRYVFTGSCSGFEGLPTIQFEAAARFDWLGQWGKAYESVKVTGGVTGQVSSFRERCTKDPFVHGHGVCTDSGNFTFSKMLADAKIIPKQLPLFAGRVPANQAYATGSSAPPPPCPPTAKNQVRIVTPTENQVFPGAPATFLVTFAPLCPKEPPEGGVRLEWQRLQAAGSWISLPEEVQTVSHHTMGQQVKLDLKGAYRLRATSRPDLAWGAWRHFRVGPPTIDPKVAIPPPKP